LNLFPEHLNYHGSVAAYYKAKKNIFRFQKKGDLAFRPPFSDVQIPLADSEIPLLGEHNRQNIRAAISVCKALGVSDSTISQALKNFHPLPHRLELVGIFSEISFCDDAISTTPESTIAAIKALKNVETIFLGGEDRGYDFRDLEKTLREHHIQNIVLFPDTGNRILRSREGFRILETQKMEEAVAFAFAHTQKGKICLLSTASPSYSLWKNFEEKGDHFQRCVKEVGEKEEKK
jgi:UDP-N-acetylmuramoyl-L-alanine---L-glutamate ligase